MFLFLKKKTKKKITETGKTDFELVLKRWLYLTAMLFPLLSLILANFIQMKFVSYPVFAFSHELTVAYKMFLERVYPIRSLLNFVMRKHENHRSFLA